ncbi:Intimin [Desulfuromonas sp. DDH964]|nr:Intimin [Desulfuromonas sp. DDH964]
MLAVILLMAGGCGKESDSTTTSPTNINNSEVTAVSLTTGSNSITADGTASTLLRAVVSGGSGPIEGATVTFSTTLGNVNPSSAITNANGIAQVSLVSGTSIGTAQVNAIAGGVSADSQSVAFVAGAPVIPTISFFPSTTQPNGTSMINVAVVDANGNPASGEALAFAITTNTSGGSLGSLTATTDINGQASINYTAGSTTGDDIVSVRTMSNALTASSTLTVSASAVVIKSVSLSSGVSSITADGTSNTLMRALVLDIDNKPVPGASVSFTTTLGTLSAASATTDAAGYASVSLTSTTSTGSATVQASFGGFTASTAVSFVPGPVATITLQATPTSVALGETSGLIATATDAQGNAVSNATLIFTVSPNTTSGNLSALTATTNLSGLATLNYTAGNAAGTDTISVRSSNIKTATVDINVFYKLASITIDQISPSSVLAAGGSATLRATAVDVNGNAAAGITLSTVVSAGSAVVTATNGGMTDAFGQETFSITDPTAENITLRVYSGIVSREQTFTFGPTLSITPSAVNATGAATLTAYLRDGNSGGIPGVSLTFIPNYGDSDNLLTPSVGVTDQNGAVTLTATDTGNNGSTIGILAQVSGVPSISGTANVTFKAPTATYGTTASATLSALKVNDTSTVVTTVTDLGTKLPAAGQTLDISVNGAATITPAGPYTTDINGEVSVTVTDATAENVVVTVTGSETIEIPLYFGSSLQFAPATSESIADGSSSKTLVATVVDYGNSRVAGVPVNFQVTVGDALLSTGSAITNSLGQASVEVTDSTIETATIRAAAGSLATKDVTVDFLAGDPATITLTSLPVNTTALSLFGQATLTATVKDLLGNNVADNTPVTFSLSGTATAATVTTSATTTNGEATASLNAGNVSGSLTVTATAGLVSKTITFTVAPSAAGSVQVVSVIPEFVQQLGQPGTQTSVITFAVKDPGSNPVADGTPVTLSLDPLQLGGGELLSDGSSPYATSVTTNTVAGQAFATFRAGTVSGTVDITATVASSLGSDISTVAQVTVVSGTPDSLHLPVSGSPLNVPSLLYDGCTSAYNITVGDRYGNPVPDGTNVSFMVEPGCATIGDSATGFVTSTTKGKIAETVTHGLDFNFPSPPLSDVSHCQVVAYVTGNEGFQDVNGNGVYDAGDICTGDQGEPYIDGNESGFYEAGELYVDVDENNAYTPANGTCDTSTTIWRKFDYLMSGAMGMSVVPDPALGFALEIGESQNFTITIEDANGAPPIAGTELNITTSAGTLVNGGKSVIGDTATASPWVRTFTLLSDIDPTATPTQTIITITLTFPGGVCGDNGPNLTGEIAGVINLPAAVPAPSVLWTIPQDGDTNIPVNGTVIVAFDQSMNKNTVSATTVTADCGGTLYNFATVASASGDTEFTFSLGSGITFPAASNCTVTISDAVRNTNGVNMAAPYSLTFTTQ